MIIKAGHPSFWGYIDSLKKKTGWSSPLHTKSALNWYKQRYIDDQKVTTDESYVVVWENHPVIAFQGAIVEQDPANNDLCAFEIPCVSVESKTQLTAKASKEFITEFEKIISKVNGSIIIRDYLIDRELSTLSHYLLANGSIVSPGFTREIDLMYDEIILKRNLRKSYKSLVNWGMRELKPKIIDSSNVEWENIIEFMELHYQEAGRRTRTEKSWHLQYEMIKAGEAFAVFGYLNNEIVSAGFFMHSNTHCFYGVSASKRSFFEKPMFHSLMWSAILHAKKIGCSRFEVGEQLYLNHPSEKHSTKKEFGISEFKAGFGGKTTCQLLLTLKLSKKV